MENNQGNSNSSNKKITTANVHEILGKSSDIVIRQVYVGGLKTLPATLIFIDGLVSQDKISEFVLKPLNENQLLRNSINEKDALTKILDGAIYFATTKAVEKIDEVIKLMMSGYSCLIFDTENKAIAFETKGYEKRSISASTEETSFRGMKVAFLENLRDNTAILRMLIKTPNLCIEELSVGKQTNTVINVLYMQDICNPTFVDTVKSRLKSIDVDKALFLEDVIAYLSEKKFSLIPQVQITEKPDHVAAGLLEGKVAIIIEGIPYGLVMPLVANDVFQTVTGYGTNYIMSSSFRILSYSLFFISLVLPGFYVALTRFHIEMLPGSLAYAIAASKIDTPFPIHIEILVMLFTFFTLLQASSNTPSIISSTVAIVGGLVLGEAAITAKLVSPAVVVVVAGSAISSLAIANTDANMALWIYMVINVLLSTVLGIFGLAIGFLVLIYQLSKMEVLGVPFLSPYAGTKKFQIEDSFIRLPSNMLKYRPFYLEPKNKKRKK